MAALEGFELSISTGDVVVGQGLYNGVAVATATLDVSVLALGDGTHYVLLDGTTISASVAAPTGTAIVLGRFVEDTAAATSVTMAGRGTPVAASA